MYKNGHIEIPIMRKQEEERPKLSIRLLILNVENCMLKKVNVSI
jgi:hypothetical protein